MTIIFPNPNAPPPADPAGMTVMYAGTPEDKKDKAVEEMLSEYGVKKRGEEYDSFKSGHRFLFYDIPRKYLPHAIRKLKLSNFYSEEGALYEKQRK